MNGKISSFKVFLVFYLVLLLYHAAHLHLHSIAAIVSLLFGVILALVAHTRRGYATIILLVVHMAIEWTEYAHEGNLYSKREIVLYAIHVILDLVFLWHEIIAHRKQEKLTVMGLIVLGLACITILVYKILPITFTEKYGSTYIEPLIIGGIISCTAWHLIKKKKLKPIY